MSKRTIAKFCKFVIIICAGSALLQGCGGDASRSPAKRSATFGPPQIVGKIASTKVVESSGLAASKCAPGVFWTHNDSGDGPYLYGVGPAGQDLGAFRVTAATNRDWEDIAAFRDGSQKCYLYIGDIGDNDRKRETHEVYRVAEPTVGQAGENGETAPAEVMRFRYPDGNHNAEALIVEPVSGDIYVLTKSASGPSGVYQIRSELTNAEVVTAVKVADLKLPSVPNGTVTGADVAPDGRRLVLCDYASAYEYSLSPDAPSFNDIWKQQADVIDIGDRLVGEAIAYGADGLSIWATSEKPSPPLIEVKRLK